jgi:hypothetical protein
MRQDDKHDVTAEQDTTGRTVVGLFARREEADAAIRDLKAAGFTDRQVGVALQDREEQRELLESTGAREAEGAAAGAVSGGIIGGLIGLLGSLLIPGVGPVVVGGVLASTLTGVGIGAATGGVIGALMGMGVPESDARHFDQGLRSGNALVTVDAGARTSEALAILERNGMDFGPSGTGRYGAFDRAAASAGAIGDPMLSGLDTGLAGMGMVDDGVGGAGGSDAGIGAPGGGTLGGIGVGDVASGSSTGSRGLPSSRQYAGRERRARRDPAYSGPERRLEAV